MSRRVDPRGMRVGVTQNWKSIWFADADLYAKNLIEDDKIRRYLQKSLRGAGLEDILIERSIKSVKIIIRVSKPGLVIGRRGTGLADMRGHINKFTKSDIELLVEEVKEPYFSANIVAETVALQLEKRVNYRRAINMAVEKSMDAGAKGCRIVVSGVVQGPNSIAMEESVTKGAVPSHTLRANIDYAKATAYTRGGTIGIKVWIYKGEI